MSAGALARFPKERGSVTRSNARHSGRPRTFTSLVPGHVHAIWAARTKSTRHLVPYKQIPPIGHAKSLANPVESSLIQPDPTKNNENLSTKIDLPLAG
jgi:hypothetical protein